MTARQTRVVPQSSANVSAPAAAGAANAAAPAVARVQSAQKKRKAPPTEPLAGGAATDFAAILKQLDFVEWGTPGLQWNPVFRSSVFDQRLEWLLACRDESKQEVLFVGIRRTNKSKVETAIPRVCASAYSVPYLVQVLYPGVLVGLCM